MKNSILLIEDEPLYRNLIFSHLKNDYIVIQTENGQEAINYIEQNNIPDLIIADLNMPVMNGYQFISYLKSNSNYSKIPIIIISGENMLMLKNRCYKAGANKFLVKPIDFTLLSLSIQELLEKHVENPIIKKG